MPKTRKYARYKEPRTSVILYLPPDLLEALDERRGKTGLSRNETLLRMIRRFLAPPS